MSVNEEELNTEADVKPRQRKTVTLADDVVELGEQLARDENRNFSNYIETLILRDAGIARAKSEATPNREVAA